MLILTRKERQKIIINNEITLTYLGRDKYHPDQIRIGIDAPPGSEIYREEIHQNILKYGRYHNKPSK